ncbi:MULTISPECIES: LacI family DNA-binding transcriptional regulator [Clostridium]|uniref:LacI family DNA-binding transcriptional regulator n=1 Tax=Clostridium TaxID=1485 RepID=UPI00069CC18F|nr:MULTISPECIES: LacI family DNA-binding transcriptional regulator [Clostridium]MCD2347061.1 LacI family transcriptional regulator [Clostridium guangxiense]
MATINDVAKMAGVGTTTVSRVINNSPLVSNETKQKVLAAINKLNYYPSNLARGLATYSTHTIGLIMDNTMDKVYANPFIYEVFRGIEKSVYEGGYNLLLLGKNTRQNGKLAVENVLHGKMVDGLILQNHLIVSNYLDNIEKYKLPIVAIGKLDKKYNISSVDIDNFNAGYICAQHLYEKGYKKIAFAGIDPNKIFANDRYIGYKKYIKEKGLIPIVPNESFSNVDSIICIDNIYAYKIMLKCKKLGKKIPNDIGIITFDNYPLAEYVEPPITNIETDLYEVGIQAGNEILRKLKDNSNDARSIKVPVSINIRSST